MSLGALLEAARAFHAATPALAAFAPFPAAPPRRGIEPRSVPAVDRLREDFRAETDPLVRAVIAAAPLVRWRRTYAEAEVGADFLARYGWFELYGPTGPFACGDGRAFLAYWGRGLVYPWHAHEAEEIYATVAGRAAYLVAGEGEVDGTRGATRLHRSRQAHALRTGDEPVLAFVMWRGSGLEAGPMLTDEAGWSLRP